MEEFSAALLRIPQDLIIQSNKIVEAEAYRAASEIQARYPVRTGNLRKGVRVRQRFSKRGDIIVTVTNTAKLALIYELGTEARHYFTVNGVKHLTGRMPAGRVFLTIVPQRLRSMLLKLRDLVAAHGFRVSGDAAA